MKKFTIFIFLIMLGAASSLAQRQLKTFWVSSHSLTDGRIYRRFEFTKDDGEKEGYKKTDSLKFGNFTVWLEGRDATMPYELIRSNYPLVVHVSHSSNYDIRSVTIKGEDKYSVKNDLSSSQNRVFQSTTTSEKGVQTITVEYDRLLANGKGTKDSPYLIYTADDWKNLAAIVNGEVARQDSRNVDAKLCNDIDLGDGKDCMIGGGKATASDGSTYTSTYNGTFDGQGHKVTVNFSEPGEGVAPFGLVNSGTTIKNLRTSGTYTVSSKYAAGIVGRATGNGSGLSLIKCESDVKITADVNGDATTGGLVGLVKDKCRISLTDCAFYGSITGKNATNCGGLIGWVEKYDDYNTAGFLHNCLYAGTFDLKTSDGSSTLARSRDGKWLSIDNCYYLDALGKMQGTKIDESGLKSGREASMLQKSRTDDSYWAQELGTTNAPKLYWPSLNKKGLLYYNVNKKSWYCDDLTINDGTYQPIGLNFMAGKVSFSRNFSKKDGDLHTLCLPYDVTVKGNLGYTAYKLESFGSNYVRFSEIKEGETLKAYYPYIIQTKGNGGINSGAFTSTEAKLNTPPDSPNSWLASSSAGHCYFEASHEGLDYNSALMKDAYILQSDKLWHPVSNDDNTAFIPPYRGYMKISLNGGASAKALAMVLGGEDQTTGIGGIEINNEDEGTRYYNLSGQYVGTSLDNMPQGIYINNKGKKIKK